LAGHPTPALAACDVTDDERLRRYAEEAASEPLLSREEECEVALAIARGDSESRQRLLRANMRLVVSIAQQHRGRGLPLAVLAASGHSGLERAVERYDVSKGYRLSTYATWWIRQAIARAIADQGRKEP
jgi:RNA polymerase primary sigma factor